jgi:signal transduction histidine kinase
VGGLECWLAAGVPQRALTTVAIGLVALAVAVRRRWPAGALILAASVITAQAPLGGGIGETDGVGMMLALVVLTYTAAASLELPRAALALAAGAAIFSGFVVAIAPDAGAAIGNGAFAMPLLFAAPWSVGRWARRHGDRAVAFAELAAETAARHALQERQAIESERERIRRELHDIIAHSVSAMVIGAGGARRLLGSDPERARDSILTIERTGREALADLRRMLGMLRRDEDPQLLAPQPGIGQLPALIESLRGLRCELRYEGEPLALTPGVDLVGYRAIEAALECAARHGCTHATVTVRHLPAVLELDVRAADAVIDVERELRAMAERVALYDGSLTAELDCVNVRLPLRAQVLA